MYLEIPVQLGVRRALVDAQCLVSSEPCLAPKNLVELCVFSAWPVANVASSPVSLQIEWQEYIIFGCGLVRGRLSHGGALVSGQGVRG